MGNLCGKESQDNFQGPGRVLSAAPAPSNNARSSVPTKASNAPAAKPKVTGPGRNLGGGEGRGDARSAAAAAAEARANKPASGDLAKKLEAQKKLTQNQTLQQVAYENRAQRDADAVNEARTYH
ncbi:hypothetical protein P154DRAFT_526022 [Amniculicola lignicola CBS 123094]|uniref:Uncharacterized protein n=1 Tax=Amniculicola lignicola CBS 123094 TaxID=1392246 RepID=A0A6A5W3W6_9PLEO|nr:hypothetical protein P154DRAFT_526022 [Amniculicola lignicola CBS 123094]